MHCYRLIRFAAAAFIALPAIAQLPAFIPVADTMLQNPDPADWLMWRRTLNSWVTVR